MKHLETIIFFIVCVFIGLVFIGCEEEVEISDVVKLADGKVVVLYSDGKWVLCDQDSTLHQWQDINGESVFEAMVVDVIDGDTYRVEILNPACGIQQYETVRLLGVDAPEIGSNEYYSVESKNYVQSKILNRSIVLELGEDSRDRFCRLLAYVKIYTDESLNEDLLLKGYARIFPNKYHKLYYRFIELQEQAMTLGNGLWKSPTEGVKIIYIFNHRMSEYVAIKNTVKEDIDVSGWKVGDKTGILFSFPTGTILGPKEIIKIYSGNIDGNIEESKLIIGNNPIWNNQGDTAFLYDNYMKLVDEYSY